jgi:hypothetical protein
MRKADFRIRNAEDRAQKRRKIKSVCEAKGYEAERLGNHDAAIEFFQMAENYGETKDNEQ